MGEYFLIVLAFWWQWILIIRDPHANMYYLLRLPNNLNHLYVHTPTLMWSDYHWQMLSQHSSFISKCEEKQKVASERKWCSNCFAKIMLVKMIEVIFLPTLLCGCYDWNNRSIFDKIQMLQLNVQCWWIWGSLVFAQYQTFTKTTNKFKVRWFPSQRSCLSKVLPVCSREKKMLNIWKTIAGTSADLNPTIYYSFPIEISEKTLVLGLLLQEGFDLPEKLLLRLIWHQVATLRGNLLRTGWRWSSRKNLSTDQDKSQVFSWSKPGPNPQQWSCPIPSLSQRPCRQASPAHTYYQPKGSLSKALLQILPDLSNHILPI